MTSSYPNALSTLDVQGFKHFFKLTWEPFEAQFGPIEARFSDHSIVVVRLASIDYQTRVLGLLEDSKRRGEYIITGYSLIILYLLTWR